MLHHIAKLKINFKLISNAARYLTRLKEMLWFWIDWKQRFNGVGRAFSKDAHWPQVLETMTFWGRSEWLSLCFHSACFPMPIPVCHIEYSAPIITYTLLGCGSRHTQKLQLEWDQQTATRQEISFQGLRNQKVHSLQKEIPWRPCSVSLLKVFGHNSLSQAICPVNILEEPEMN